jgi:hypothetical protein
LTLFNITESSGNPNTSLASYGTTFLLPGGAGVQTTQTQFANPQPFLGVPRQEAMESEVLDVTVSGGLATPAISGQVLAMNYAANNYGAAQWSIPNQAASAFLTGQFGIVIKPGSTQPIDELPAGSGVGAVVVWQGPVQALCTTPGTTAITYGTFLQTDGSGNLQPIQPPSTPTSVTVTPTGGSATAYSYKVAAVSANGTVSPLSTAGSTAAGAATLTTSAYNTITWTTAGDAVGFYIVRSASSGTPASTGTIGYVNSGSATSFVDTGIVAYGNTTATQPIPTLAAGTTPTVTPQGTAASTNYSYKISAIGPNGVWGAEGSAGSTSTGAATLTTVNNNKITWTAVSGAVGYVIDRTVGGATQGVIGYASPGQATTGFVDSGLVATAYAQNVTPTPTPGNGVALARSLGVLAAGTTTPTLVWVFVGQD